jgi:penicillin amidase
MRRVGRALLWLVALLLVAALIAGFAYRRLTLPKLDGTATVVGLIAPVDVVRDAAGIPHVFAANDDDAWFTLGYLHAQDRLWQMELNRRTAAGRLAEILGPGALETDRFLRTLGIGRNAAAIAANLDDKTRHALARYAAGVNANLEQRRHAPRAFLGLEFVLTGAPFPEPWTPADSVGWSTMMAWTCRPTGAARSPACALRSASRSSRSTS